MSRPDQDTVSSAIAAQAVGTPDAVAMACGARRVTYRALARRVERWASALSRRGIGPETIVAIQLPRSEALVIAILATLRAGAAYLPIDPLQPPARCRHIIAASGAVALIAVSGEACDRDVPLLSPVDLDRMEDAVMGPPLPTGGQVAYVIYTSGSTGSPKGVAVEHAALLNHMRWMLDAFGTVADRVVQRTSCAFDASVWEFLLPFMAGGTLVIPDDDDQDPRALGALIARELPSAVQCVPTFLRFALDQGAFDRTTLPVLFVGGEPLPNALVQRARQAFAADVVNLYGPTETTIDATYCRCDERLARGDWQPIGRPIANVHAVPTSSRYEAVSDDVSGELWIGGAGLARGYHRDSRATARAFVPDPHGDRPGARAYRTGDLVTRQDGRLTFIGRADRLVKLHGFRIETSEIEAILRRHTQVGDAVVQVDTSRDRAVLVAWCLRARIGGGDDADALRNHVMQYLPHYMVPAQFVWLDRFPVKPNGKVDYASLRRPDVGLRGDAPETMAEHVLAEAWQQLFRRPVGVTDNFFEIGGDSIRCLQLISLVRAHGAALTLQDIFQAPTIRALAPRMRPSAVSDAHAAFALLPEVDRHQLDRRGLEDAYPTTALLDALYFLSRTSSQYEVYVTSCELAASWNPDAFRTALERIVARHAWLRTAFAYEGFSRPLQVVHEQVPIQWDVEDLTGMPASQQEAHLLDWFEREKRRPFDWARVPVWRIAIHRKAPDRLQLTLSEPIFDGWSVSSLLGELIADYAAACRAALPPPRPTPRARYRDFVVAEQAALRSEPCVEFWRQSVAGDVGRTVPRLGPPGDDRGVRRIEVRLSAEASARLRERARHASVSLKSVLLAVHARVLGTITGRAKVVTGVIMNGRAETPEAEQVLGLHINTVPLLLDLTRSRTWFELIRHVFEVEKAALPYRRYPLASIQKLHGRMPLFDAAFNFTHFHGLADVLRGSGLVVTRYLAWDQTFFPLTAQFHVDLIDSTIGLGLDYDAATFDAGQIQDYAQVYRDALQLAIEAPERSCKAALHRAAPIVLPPSPAADALDVAEAFRRTVQRQPDAVALVSGEIQVSYGALSRAVATVADDLRRREAVGRSVLVLCDSQYEGVVALLASLDAGAVYVPVDPAFPSARIERIAAHAGASLCLCDERHVPAVTALGLDAVPLDLGRAMRQVPRAARPRSGPAPAAYRIYTSGSTGVPKGVEVGHDALAHFVTAMRRAGRISEHDVVAGITTLAFDISLLEMLVPLTTGARLVTIARDHCRNGERLAGDLTRAEVTMCQATPTTWRMLMDTHADLMPGLNAISGGEALPADLARRLLAAGVHLTNAYGPTETTIWSMVGTIRHATAVTLGEPLGRTSIRIVDAFGDDCLSGVPGEIVIGGAGLAHGYVGSPGLTAERFIPDVSGAGGRCYRTGDSGRRGRDGSIEFLGRVDDQVKIRGHRIELQEIELVLRSCPGVRDAAVKVVGAEAAGLAGYVVLEPNAGWDDDEVRHRLRRSLPDYMIPRHFVVLAALPLTPNQKVDRARLPLPDVTASRGTRVRELYERVKAMTADDVRRALAEVHV
jgi:amino acid adenylation domain-containing protein